MGFGGASSVRDLRGLAFCGFVGIMTGSDGLDAEIEESIFGLRSKARVLFGMSLGREGWEKSLPLSVGCLD